MISYLLCQSGFVTIMKYLRQVNLGGDSLLTDLEVQGLGVGVSLVLVRACLSFMASRPVTVAGSIETVGSGSGFCGNSFARTYQEIP